METRKREVGSFEEEIRPTAPGTLAAPYNLPALGAGQSRGLEAGQHRDLGPGQHRDLGGGLVVEFTN